MAGSVEWVANVGFTWQPASRWSASASYQYLSEWQRAANDPRPNLDGHQRVDLGLNIHDFVSAGVNFRLSVLNAFDEEVVFPAPLGTYPDDYPVEGRSYWLTIEKEFR